MENPRGQRSMEIFYHFRRRYSAIIIVLFLFSGTRSRKKKNRRRRRRKIILLFFFFFFFYYNSSRRRRWCIIIVFFFLLASRIAFGASRGLGECSGCGDLRKKENAHRFLGTPTPRFHVPDVTERNHIVSLFTCWCIAISRTSTCLVHQHHDARSENLE